MTYLKKLRILTTLRFFVFIIFTIVIFFNFFDISVFKLSRSFHGLFFEFFKEIVDPISDILDPLHIIIICLLILVFNTNIKYTLSNNDITNLTSWFCAELECCSIDTKHVYYLFNHVTRC